MIGKKKADKKAIRTFDDDVQLGAAQADPVGFVADLTDRTVLDEVQRVPALFLSLKTAVDRDRRSERFILTGSSNVLLVPMGTFFSAWRKTLEKKWTKVRTAVLLLEAVHHLEGLDGVSRLVRKWKNKQPAGYLYWLDILKKAIGFLKSKEAGDPDEQSLYIKCLLMAGR